MKWCIMSLKVFLSINEITPDNSAEIIIKKKKASTFNSICSVHRYLDMRSLRHVSSVNSQNVYNNRSFILSKHIKSLTFFKKNARSHVLYFWSEYCKFLSKSIFGYIRAIF